MKSFYNSCGPCQTKPLDTRNGCDKQSPSYGKSCFKPSTCPPTFPYKPPTKTPMEECQDKRKKNLKCGRPPDDCYDIKLAIPPMNGDGGVKFNRLFCPTSAGDTSSQIFHLCDNEVISLANTCGEITLSRQCLEDEDTYEAMKQNKDVEKKKRKNEKKKGKERFKQCKKNAKQILKKYKDREKQRAANEKEYYKKCLKLEQKKVKNAKQRLKEKKKLAKDRMKHNKQKNKQKLKRLKQRLKQRCEEMKTRDPNEPRTDSDDCDSMDLEDPMDISAVGPPCDGELTCYSLSTINEKPVYGCRGPTQVCVGNLANPCQMNTTAVSAKMPCAPCAR